MSLLHSQSSQENVPSSANVLQLSSSPPPLPPPVQPLVETPVSSFRSHTPFGQCDTHTPIPSLPDSSLLQTQGKENIQPFPIDSCLLKKCMVGCRSRKNLAGRLTLSLFNEKERKTSNCRGVRGKSKLDPAKLKAIKLACIRQYRPKPSDNTLLIMKEIRISIDEACRRVPRQKQIDEEAVLNVAQDYENNWDIWESVDLEFH